MNVKCDGNIINLLDEGSKRTSALRHKLDRRSSGKRGKHLSASPRRRVKFSNEPRREHRLLEASAAFDKYSKTMSIIFLKACKSAHLYAQPQSVPVLACLVALIARRRHL